MTNVIAWEALLTTLKVIYALCMLAVLIPGLNSLFLACTYWRHRQRLPRPSDFTPPTSWPRVTVQLPIYNEGQLVIRLLRAITRLDYPRDRLEIQVLDDSTDETSALARALVERYRRAGFQIVYRHRTNRQGYKAGNLAAGLPAAKGELIAIFDADFLPPRDWLKRVVPAFQDPHVGFVQTRWVHYNAHANLLSRLVALAMDGHAIVEQGGRAAGGFFIGFDGSGGIWRRTCIETAGGWQWDTLTEDLDLAYRAQLLGWKGLYLPDVTVQAEVPETMAALRRQQYRWAKGSVQTLRKLGARLWRAPLPWQIRLEGLLHLSMYVPFPFAVLAFLLILPIGVWSPSYFNFFFWSALGGLGLAAEYLVAQTETYSTWRQRLSLLPGMAVLGIGISLTCAVGALDGLLHEGGVFERTPKALTQESAAIRPAQSAKTLYNYLEWGERLLSLYLLTSALILARHAQAAMLPWAFIGFTAFLLASQGAFLEEPQPTSTTIAPPNHHLTSLPK
ncbi:glycosyltransferase [uncultured Thermanaerothrix sp.]|uniref:glycosyltransferase n=1 Tax=uncultured Thermanaerothrix sp. TaxID=1195149 RepID=UPI002639591B|nr:glycosyltransferase [uncultured Thermanaerothrix sp.]